MNILNKLKVLLSSVVLMSVALSQGGGKVKADNAQVQEDGRAHV